MPKAAETWMRHFLEEEDAISRDELVAETGLTRAYIGKLERGERRPSPKAAQRVAGALGEPVEDVFPMDGRPSPDRVAGHFLAHLRNRKSGKRKQPDAPDEFEAYCRAHDLDYEEELDAMGNDVAYFPDDDHVVIDFSRMDESVHAVRIKVTPIRAKKAAPRAREHKASKSRKTRQTRKSSSDDPGEPHLPSFVMRIRLTQAACLSAVISS